jgi:catechol 2,3-dioxygenase-like lactoylglutathione lyase family enzyme
MSPGGPLFRKLDNLLLRVADLDAAISFYRDQLGHRVLWRSEEAVGFALPDTDAELVVHLHIGPETDVLVENVDEAFKFFLNAGGEALSPLSISRLADARAFAIPSATTWSSWISRRAFWRRTRRGG